MADTKNMRSEEAQAEYQRRWDTRRRNKKAREEEWDKRMAKWRRWAVENPEAARETERTLLLSYDEPTYRLEDMQPISATIH
jgi:hypothetical protein